MRLLARLSDAMAARGLPRPVLVGGGAAEFYSGSALMTGDIDLTSPAQAELEEEVVKLGFARPSGAGSSLRGWYVLSLEDLIADRAGQFASGSAPEMRDQAAILLRLYPRLDRDYLESRIREETLGEFGAEDFQS